jgi:hypothetical protein
MGFCYENNTSFLSFDIFFVGFLSEKAKIDKILVASFEVDFYNSPEIRLFGDIFVST